jgi:hypothetical protein
MKSKSYRWRRALLSCSLLAAVLAAACGGGEQVQKFVPTRIVALGDESSVLDDSATPANARKYSVNGTVSATDPAFDCRVNPLWIQQLGNRYGMVFPQCNAQPNAVVAPRSRVRATPGAKVADLAAQVAAQNAESPFGAGDMVAVLIGQNDVLAAYARFPGVDEAQLTLDLEATGAVLGTQINQIAATGAKVLVSTIYNLGVTPFGQAENKAHSDVSRAALLARLTSRFNAAMRRTILNDGRQIGLMLTDEYIEGVIAVAGAGGFSNVTVPACDLTKSSLVPPSLLDCSRLTLVPGATGDSHLWADTTHLTSGGQRGVGDIAVFRAENNPF